MPTIPTGRMERALRALYLRWVQGLTPDSNMTEQIAAFQRDSEQLITRMGGRAAALGAFGDFPAPKLLELSPYAGAVYQDMQQAAIRGSIMTGLNARDAAQAMFRAGMDKSYRRLEMVARTETVRAYWRNAWDSVAGLPLVMVWGAENGPRTCEWCRERDGLVISSAGLRDHPNGRCTPIPTLKSKVRYRGSVDRDGTIFDDPNWVDTVSDMNVLEMVG